MNSKYPFGWTATCSVAAALTLVGTTSVHAQTLQFDHAPVSNVVAKLSRTYGINIVLKGGILETQRVSFSVNNTDPSGAALEAVNNLANALGSDYQKVFVVSKIAPDLVVPQVRIDSDAPVMFRSQTVDVQTAIQTIASVDAAVLKGEPIDGNVTLSSASLSAADAAQEIAQKTHTQWKAFYAITPRNSQASATAAKGTVIDHTKGGQPIVQLPYSTYTSPTVSAPVNTTPAQTANQTAANMPNGQMPNGQYPNGQYPNGYPMTNAPYGYNSYAPYNYNPYNPYNSGYSMSNGALTVLPPNPFSYNTPYVFGGTNTVTYP